MKIAWAEITKVISSIVTGLNEQNDAIAGIQADLISAIALVQWDMTPDLAPLQARLKRKLQKLQEAFHKLDTSAGAFEDTFTPTLALKD